MATFTDISGQDWLVELTVLHTDRLRRGVGVNLNDALVRDDSGRSVLERISGDPGLLVAVLHSICSDQIVERGLTPEDFARLFAGDVIDSASAALAEALCDFFPKRLRQTMHLARRKVAERIERMSPDTKMIEAAIDQELDRLLPLTNTTSQNRETSTGPSNGLPESSGSIPDH